MTYYGKFKAPKREYVKCIQVLNSAMYVGTTYVQCMCVMNMHSAQMLKFLKGKIRDITFKKWALLMDRAYN